MNSNNNKILKALHTSGKNFRMNLHSIKKKQKKTQKQNLRTKKIKKKKKKKQPSCQNSML